MLTAIQFIGLIVTTFTGSPTVTGAELIIGRLNPTTQHVRIIAYQKNKLVSVNWPGLPGPSFTGCDGIQYDSVTLNVDNVTISGIPEPWNNQLGSMPHLTCCCSNYNAFNPAYGNKNQTNGRSSAFVNFSNGTYTTWRMPTGAIATVLFSNTTSNITFTASTPGGNGATKTLTVQPGASVMIANEVQSVLSCQPMSPPPGPPDFVQYYTMRANTTPPCGAVPGNPSPNPCAPANNSCPTTPAVAPGTPYQPDHTPVLTAQQQQWINAHQSKQNTIDINCSSSQWP